MKGIILSALVVLSTCNVFRAQAQCNTTTTPTNNCTYGDAINAFTLNSIATTGNGGCSSSGYGFFSTPVRSLTQGLTYSFSVTVGSSTYNEGFAIWIDLNNNGQYESSEQVYASTTWAQSFTGNITIPATATVANNVRMRTMCAWNSTISSTQACTSGLGSGYGETEDYYVNILAGCPVAFTTQPKDSAACVGNNAGFSVVATSTTGYQWQVSTNGGSSWNNISNGSLYGGVTTASMTITGVTSAMDNYLYRCVASNSSSSCSVNSNSAKLTVNIIPAITATTPDTVCTGSPAAVTATPTTGATVKWYDQATGGTLLGTGNTLNIASAPAINTNYYAFPEGATVVTNDSLAVQLAATNSQRGCYMDIKALTALKMTYVYWVPSATGTYDVDIYFRTGTAVGNELSSSGWSLIGSQTSVSATISTPVKMVLSTQPNLAANTTYSILVIRSASTTGNIRYQSVSTLGGIEAQNADIQLISAKGIDGLFSGNLFSPRHLACIIGYQKTFAPPCTASSRTPVAVVVTAPPTVTTQPTDKTLCAGANTSFAIVAKGASTYQWEVSTNGGSTYTDVANGGVYGGATTNTLNITGATAGMNSYKYRCKASCATTTTSNAATLNINSAPAVTGQPGDKSICDNSNTSFSITATGSGTLGYQWEVSTNGGSTWSTVFNGGVYSGATTATLTLTGATAALNTYQYRCIVTGTCPPTATSNAGVLTIKTAPTVTAEPTDKDACPTTNTSFTFTAGGGNIVYQWQEFTTAWANLSNGGIYAGVGTNTLSLSNVHAGLNGRKYRCVLTNGCSPDDTTDEATLNIGSTPAIAASSNTPVCERSALNLTSGGPSSGVTYSWTGPNSFTSTSSNPTNSTPVLADGGDYIVTATQTSNGCFAKDTTNVVVKLTPAKPAVTSNTPVCTKYDINLTASSTTGSSYNWTGPTGFSSTMQNPVRTNATVQMAGYYKVTATINGCTSPADSTMVSVILSPEVFAYPSPGSTVCEGDTIKFFGSSANSGTGPLYQWMKNGLPIAGEDSLKYFATGLANGDIISLRLTPGTGVSCNSPVSSPSIPVGILPYKAPSVSISMDPPADIWPGLLVTFTAMATDAGNKPKYQWMLNGTAVQGATSDTWAATTLQDNDVVVCDIESNYKCADPQTATSNQLTVPVRVSVNMLDNRNNISLYPNPNQGSFTLKGNFGIGQIEVEILNALGQVVYQHKFESTSNMLQQAIQAGSLVDGIYLLRVHNGREMSHASFRIAN